MLKKLLKYDSQSIFKVLIIFYSLSLFFAILTRIFLNISNSLLMNIIGQICSGVTISMIFNILINNLIRLWVRFKSNFYADESYLTHSLPVEKKTLYLSKVVSSAVTCFTSLLVIGAVLFIAYYSKENIELIKKLLLPIANAYDSTIIAILSAFLFILFLEFFNILQCGFTGIIIGHKMNTAKTGFSVLFGFIAFMISQFFAVLMIFAVALFNKDFMNLFVTNQIVDVDTIKAVIYISIAVYTLLLLIGYLVNIKLFKKGVNVD